MKNLFKTLIAVAIVSVTVQSCKKGEDDNDLRKKVNAIFLSSSLNSIFLNMLKRHNKNKLIYILT
jgi:hypothetical protein